MCIREQAIGALERLAVDEVLRLPKGVGAVRQGATTPARARPPMVHSPQCEFDGVDQRGLAARPPAGDHRDARSAVGGRRLELEALHAAEAAEVVQFQLDELDLPTPHSRYRLLPGDA